MTLKEATIAAEKRIPVLYHGMRYRRIIEAGYKFTNMGERVPYVLLISEDGNTSVSAEPTRVERADLIQGEFACVLCGVYLGKGADLSAEPLTSGPCCLKCFRNLVIPAILKK